MIVKYRECLAEDLDFILLSVRMGWGAGRRGVEGFREGNTGLVSLGFELRCLIFCFNALVPQFHLFQPGPLVQFSSWG